MSEKWKEYFSSSDAFKGRKNRERVKKVKKKKLHKLSNFFYTFTNIIILKVKRNSGVHVKSKREAPAITTSGPSMSNLRAIVIVN